MEDLVTGVKAELEYDIYLDYYPSSEADLVRKNGRYQKIKMYNAYEKMMMMQHKQ
jgi:hypothetical protein